MWCNGKDTLVLETSAFNGMQVRLLSWALLKKLIMNKLELLNYKEIKENIDKILII